MAPDKDEYRSDPSLHQQPTEKSVKHDMRLRRLIETKMKINVKKRTQVTMSMVLSKQRLQKVSS